mgnify:CR=1 FL=1
MLDLCGLTKKDLENVYTIKYGSPEDAGWRPKRRHKFGYYQPSDIYETMINKLVTSDTKWIDVGGGRAIFPDNVSLSEMLATRCKKLVAVDPSDNVFEHHFANEKFNSKIEYFETEEKFDLITFRMVAEHIDNPQEVLRKLKSIIAVNGIVVIYTINRFSPIPIITWLTPFSLHFKVKKFFWGGEEKDTFPVAYKMNTRSELLSLFSKNGFSEDEFGYLDDLSALSRFRLGGLVELVLWSLFVKLKIRYPENNLLGIYKSERVD